MHIRRVYLITILCVTLLVIGVAWLILDEQQPDELSAYSLSQVKRGDLTSNVSATGTLNPVITVQVGSQVSGTIQLLLADFNSRVKKGDLIAQIEPSLFKAKLAEA